MAEQKRGCGWRKVGGIYLVGEYIQVSCDRLPFPLDVCPVCGHGVKLGRGMTKINPLMLFGTHDIYEEGKHCFIKEAKCQDKMRPCFLCDPTDEPAFVMRVGEKFYPTPEDFINEGVIQGLSKRIAQIPKEFKIGKTVIYLAHINACVVREPVSVMQQAMNLVNENEVEKPRLFETEKQKRIMGIFTAFIPQRIEKIYWQSELDKMTDKEKESLTKRGITPVGVPDGDKKHSARGDE